MISFVLFFAAGVCWLQQQATLPAPAVGWLAAGSALAWLLPREGWRGGLRWGSMAVFAASLGVFHAAFFAAQRLDDALPTDWQGRNVELLGVVAELPRQHERGLRFVFDVERVLTPGAHVPAHLQLSTYETAKDAPLALHAGERWHLTVRLKQPHGSVNPYGFDYEGWLLERNLRATGYVYRKETNARIDAEVAGYAVERWREAVRARFQSTLVSDSPTPPADGDEHPPYAGVLAALAIGDQDSIPAAQWQVFTRTGVNHLMSII